MGEIYEPAEDSYFLSEIIQKEILKFLKNNPNLTFLEIGCGSGIHLKNILKLGVKKENIFSCDLNSNAVKYCKKLGFNCVKSDLFEKINEKFDVIIFNPPYLPEDKREPESSRFATTGGKKGSELINKFLNDAKKYLNKNGKIFLITSNLAEKINFKKFGYMGKEIGCAKLFFEKLYVWELVFRN